MSEPLQQFPCLAHDPDSWEMMVCTAPKGHPEGQHAFVLGTELMVGLGPEGAEFTIEESPTVG